MIHTQVLEYYDDDVLLEGYYAVDLDLPQKRPIVLVVHDWAGRKEFSNAKARLFAEWGYVGFAIDLYGKGKVGESPEENNALMQPFIKNRLKLKQRILAAVSLIQNIEQADETKIFAIGFCFGGLCVLDLARSGDVAMLKKVVSCHGLLQPSPDIKTKPSSHTDILVLHGYNDPMVSPQSMLDFAEEMKCAQANWQIHIYGKAMHAFTNPLANDLNMGTVYDQEANMRAMGAIRAFFSEK